MGQQFKLTNVEVPVDATEIDGMQKIYGDKEDQYVAFYYPDIEYVKYGERTLRLQLIKPAFPNKKYPLLIYIQGSGWMEQQRYMSIPQLSRFAQKGYVVASVEYRHSGEKIFPAQIEDVKTAIRYLKKHAEEHSIDKERVAVWGDSSGGHMASLVGTTKDEDFKTEHYTDQTSEVKAVVDFYGPSDLSQVKNVPSKIDRTDAECPEALLLGGKVEEQMEMVQLANPIYYIEKYKQTPPFLIMHGDRDEIVPFNQSVLLYKALREQQSDVEFFKVKGAYHGPAFWTDDVLNVVEKFLKANV